MEADLSDGAENDHEESLHEPTQKLPDDLPTSLDDRRRPAVREDVEVYDAWKGQAQYLTAPAATKPLEFNLSLDEPDDDYSPPAAPIAPPDGRLDKMLAAQAAHKKDVSDSEDEEQVAKDDKLSDSDKREVLQRTLNLAASNGDVERLQRLVSGSAKDFVDLNAPDADGTAPLIYASCFGHSDVVEALLDAGAEVDLKDSSSWTSLMWATANHHKGVVEILLRHGASPESKSISGRTAFDFVEPQSDISDYLHEKGYSIGSVGVGGDFYNSGLSQDRFEEELAENEMKRRMMMESAINLEVDLGNLGLDEQAETPEDLEEEGHEFVWDKCLNDQMFVFQESELGAILDIIITNMTPQRTPSQKPVPANILFLSARYAHYHAHPELLETLFVVAMEKINDVIDRFQWDMTMLAFWISNATLLLHYLKKDVGLVSVTTDYQLQIAELINEIFVLIIRDAERRMDKVLDPAMLDHETIPGFEDIHFQGDWKIFRSSKKPIEEPIEKRYRPPSPKRRAKVSPRNITSLLSSTLFVLDLYDIHSVITTQLLTQLMYWLSAELFNRIMSNRKYLSRTKALQVRMNVSVLEEWARSNCRQPEHFENGSVVAVGENTDDAARYHLAPVIQLLQWLQIFSSIGDDKEGLTNTISQLPRLSPQQLIHSVKYYRNEVGEKGLPKPMIRYLDTLLKEVNDRKAKRKSAVPPTNNKNNNAASSSVSTQSPSTQSPPEGFQGKPSSPTTTTTTINQPTPSPSTTAPTATAPEEDPPAELLHDPSLILPFHLPTSNDMVISFGAGFGGVNREREMKYIPTVPAEFLARLDLSGSGGRGEAGAGKYGNGNVTGRGGASVYDNNENWNNDE